MDFIIDEDGNYIITEDGELIEIEGPEWFGAAEGGMRIVEPIAITDAMVGSGAGTVPEGDYADFSLATTYGEGDRVTVATSAGMFYELFPNLTNDGDGVPYAIIVDVYNVLYILGGVNATRYIYILPDCSRSAIPVKAEGSAEKFWTGGCSAPSGNVYACCNSSIDAGDIYKRTGGSGAFASLSAADLAWRAMCASAADIYACVYGGDIYKLTNEAGSFTALSAGNKNWSGMAACPVTGDIYACVYNGDIWVSTDDGASFSAIADTDRNWNGMIADNNGNIYATVKGGDIYKRTNGAGLFVALSNTSRNWAGMAYSETDGDLFAITEETGLYAAKLSAIHKNYESLVDANTGNYPPLDVVATTPKWLELSATNKWKVFDGKVNDQMKVVSPAVYTITPGEAFDTVILLNVEADSVTIAVDDPAYSETVVTGATDIVKMDLAGDADSVLTITIANSAGLAKCGEIIIGNYYEIGTMKPLPVVSITDYSVKTQDEWGNWTITQRSYSEKMSCLVNVPYASIDAVIAKLKEYRTTQVVWVGNSLYACTIIYGYWRDWSTPVAARGKSILSLEIEGLT